MSEVMSDSDCNDNQNIEDLDSCLSYLKKREVFLYKMMNDPNHKAMLYFLEVLLNSEHALLIEDLVGKFFCKNFTQDMREACGNNAVGLKKFLEKYPSLFCVSGNYVTAVAVEMPPFNNNNNSTGNSDNESSVQSNGYSSRPVKGPVKFDINKETEAVKFFQNKLLKREEKWVPIKSLAGHLSQANNDIRDVVGPQVDFKKFIARNPHVFEIQGELVSLRDYQGHKRMKSLFSNSASIDSSSCSSSQLPINNNVPTNSSRPKSLSFASPQVNNSNFNSFGKDSHGYFGGALSAPTTPQAYNHGIHLFSRNSPLSMSSNEYRAIVFLRKVIERKNNSIGLAHLFLYLARTSESVRNAIGWTKFEMMEFIRKHNAFFDLTPNEIVINRKADKINVIITGLTDSSTSNTDSCTRTLTNRSGCVFHVAKLWGIIDLGRHEHVFFDKSIFKHLDDLQRHFKIGEVLYFNAILAPKESRAKWRATQVWKECDREIVEKFYRNNMLRSSNAAVAGTLGPINTSTTMLSDGLSDVASVLTQDSLLDDYSSSYVNDGHITRILPDEVEAELTRILQITHSSSNEDDDEEETDDISVVLCRNKRHKHISSISTSPDLSSQRSNRSDPSLTNSSHALSAPAASTKHYNNNSIIGNTTTAAGAHTNGKSECSVLHNVTFPSNKMNNSVATQTLSTGDIMATNLFHE